MTGKTPLLLAPGPTEISPNVSSALAHASESHFGQVFCDVFGDTITKTRELFQSKDPNAQPFIIGGSGSLGWDFTATNFLTTGSPVLCLTTGYFADAFAECLATYGHNVTRIVSTIGGSPDLEAVERELATGKYKALVATHVETSTAVLTQLQPLSDLLKRVSPDTLFIVDAVASLAAEPLRFDDWSIDIVVTGSQKALGCPPGLSIIMTSARALETSRTAENKPAAWYVSLSRWLPIMQSYERKQTCYFATPPTQLVRALNASLTEILDIGMEETWRRHAASSQLVKNHLESLGLSQLASKPEDQSNAVTAFWVPEGVVAASLLKRVLEKGVMLAGGMHKEVGTRYLRFGHMGFSATSDRGDLNFGLHALTESLVEIYREQEPTVQEELLPNAALVVEVASG